MNRKRALIADTFCLTKRRRCAADSVTGESQGKTLFLICNQVDILLLFVFFLHVIILWLLYHSANIVSSHLVLLKKKVSNKNTVLI